MKTGLRLRGVSWSLEQEIECTMMLVSIYVPPMLEIDLHGSLSIAANNKGTGICFTIQKKLRRTDASPKIYLLFF